uniref:Rab-3A-interacting protein n=1 Tax=Plectus sambesii TaxID=2011161 RepID=A0A914XR47_9BILA
MALRLLTTADGYFYWNSLDESMESGSSGSRSGSMSNCSAPENANESGGGGGRFTNDDEIEEEREIGGNVQHFLAVTSQSSKGTLMGSVSDSHLDYTSPSSSSTALPDAVSNESGVDSEEPNHELPSLLMDKAKEHTIERLQAQLLTLQAEVNAKDAKCEKLSLMQRSRSVDTEIHELTEHLFQEAYKMVQDAQLKRVHAEKLLNESKMKIDVLTAEVEALKSLVLSQSPGRGATGSHLHQSRASPHNSPATRKTSLTPKAWLTNAANAANSPVKKLPFMQRRNTSEGIEDLPLSAADLRLIEEEERLQKQVDFKEVDPIFHKEFTQWRERPEIDPESPFLHRILNEEIKTCLHFDNMELASLVLEAITTNALEIELISEQKPTVK